MSESKQRSGRPKATAQDRKIGDEVRARRLLIGMSQGALGDALGVSFQQVQKYEKGSNRISASRLRQVAKALDVPVTHFYDAADRASAENGDAASPNCTPEGLRLLRAFERIEDRLFRRRLVDLVESFPRD